MIITFLKNYKKQDFSLENKCFMIMNYTGVITKKLEDGEGEGLTHPPLKIIILNQFHLILLINYTKKEKKVIILSDKLLHRPK